MISQYLSLTFKFLLNFRWSSHFTKSHFYRDAQFFHDLV